MLFKATLAFAGIDADIFVSDAEPASGPVVLFSRAEELPTGDS
jgi:hypothetical protein